MPSEVIKHLVRPDASTGRVRLLILVAVVLSFVRMMEATPLQSANDRSRWATAWSLVERGTYQIDEIRQYPGWDTIDKVLVERKAGEKHFYSSKPPLYATLVAGGYWIIKHTLGWTIDPENPESANRVCHLILFFLNIVPTAFALNCFAKMVWRYTEISFTRNFVLTSACFATLWSAYLPSLNNHTPAVCCVIFALRAAVVSVPSHLTSSRIATAGFMAALAVTFELPALAFLAGMFVLLLKYSPARTLVAFVPAATIPLIAFFATNYAAAEDWKPFYAAYGQTTGPVRYIYEDDGVPSYWTHPKGLDAAPDPFYTYLFHCVVGHHGLLSLTPIFVLSFIGICRVHKWQYSPLAAYHVLGALLTVVVFGYFMSKPAHFNYGGVSVGLRWMLWLAPFWLLMMIPAVDIISSNRIGQFALAVLLVPSIFSAWYPFDAPWRQPWIFEWITARGGLNQYKAQAPEFLQKPRRSWIGQLPSEETKQDDYWIELSGTAVDAVAITLRIADGGPVTVGDRSGRRVDFVWNEGRTNESRLSAVLDVKRITAGGAGDLFLVPDGAVVPLAIRELVYGLPLEPAYHAAVERYVHLPVRKNAFKSRIGVSYGARASSSPGIAVVGIRSEFWETPELPFGIAVWDLQTIHDDTRAPLAQRRLTVSRVGKFLPLAVEKAVE